MPTCANCDQPIPPSRIATHGPSVRYCTTACREGAAWKRKRASYRSGRDRQRAKTRAARLEKLRETQPPCEGCGERVPTEKLERAGKHVRYCSDACVSLAEEVRHVARAREARKERREALEEGLRVNPPLCARCGEPIPPERLHPGSKGRPVKYCSRRCGWRQQNGPRTINRGFRLISPGILEGVDDARLATATVGSAQQLRAAADLMLRGLEVFLPLTSTTSCDLLALNPDTKEVKRVEVRSGRTNGTTTLAYKKNAKSGKTDLYAVVMPDGTVSYHEEAPPDVTAS